MNQTSQLFQLFRQNNGILRMKQAVECGIRKNLFGELVLQEKIIKLARGLYALPDASIDGYACFMYRVPNGIYSHGTAAFLHGLTTRSPLVFCMTVASGANISHIQERDISVRFKYIQSGKISIGKTQAETPFGNIVTVYDRERTIIDLICSKDEMDGQVFSESLRTYFSSKRKNLLLLSEYAIQLNIEKKLRFYTDVLL